MEEEFLPHKEVPICAYQVIICTSTSGTCIHSSVKVCRYLQANMSTPLQADSTSTPPALTSSLLTDPLFIHCTRRPEFTSDGSPSTSQVRMRGEPTCRVTSPLGVDVTLRDSAGDGKRDSGRELNECLSARYPPR